MQGRLRNKYVQAEIQTKCGHCGQKITLDVDSELRWGVRETGPAPLIFEPQVDWSTFTNPTIIDDY